VRELARRRGYRTVYSAAGPQVLHTLVAARVLGRLYLTLALRLVGGADFDTLLHGGVLSPAADFRLLELHLAGAARRRAQLLFASLAPVPGGGE
jgi:riboflavin biosynthesis pyrimidine reductase